MDRYIQYNWEYQLAICVSCETGLPGGHVLRHIGKEHKETWKAHGKELEKYIKSLTLTPPKELGHPDPITRVFVYTNTNFNVWQGAGPERTPHRTDG
jgi:hypothetical protein